MITRQEYLQGKATHEEYYAQFVTPEHKSRVLAGIGLLKLLKSSERFYGDVASVDQWDRIAQPHPQQSLDKLKECGDYMTQAGAVCILKEAARQLIEESLQKQIK